MEEGSNWIVGRSLGAYSEYGYRGSRRRGILLLRNSPGKHEPQKERGDDMNPKQFLLLLTLAASIRIGAAQATSFNFDTDAAEKPPSGFTSYATGGGPAGKWLVKQMADAQSGKQVVVQTDADRTDYRFPVLIANEGEFTDLDLSVKAKSISGQIDQGMGLVFRFRDPKSYYIVRANALENNFRLYRMVNGRRLQFAGANVKVASGFGIPYARWPKAT